MGLNRRTIMLKIICLCGLLLMLIPLTTNAGYTNEVIVHSGQAAPGTSGAVFNTSSWNAPIAIGISSDGDVLFRASLEVGVGDATSDNADGLWLYSREADSVALIFRPGDQVHGVAGAVFTEYDSEFASIDQSGRIGLFAYYTVGGVQERAFFMSVKDSIGVMRRELVKGMEVWPDRPGVFLMRITPRAFNAGRLLFSAVFEEGDGIDRGFNDLALCVYEPTGISVIAQKGDPMPAIGNDYIVGSISYTQAGDQLDSLGRSIVQIIGVKFLEPDIRTVYYYEPALPLTPIARSDQDPTKIILGANRLNSGGWLARRGSTEEIGYNTEKIQSSPIIPIGPWNTIVTGGDIAPGAELATFINFRDFVLFDNNLIGTQGNLSDGRTGIWIGDEISGLQKIALVGDRAPGVDTTMVFSYVNNMMANRVGQIAFTDFADNGIDGVEGLWVGNLAGLEPVSLSDQKVRLDDVTVRTLGSFYAGHTYWTRTGADGFSALLNDEAEIAYGVSFQEGGTALLFGSPGDLIVNSNGDKPDFDLEDGLCSTGDTLPDGRPECTLRAAIAEANVQEGYNTITFDIDGDPYIEPTTSLPEIEDSVYINAFSQPGDVNVLISGEQAGDGAVGLSLRGKGITIAGFNIGRFGGSGISIVGSDEQPSDHNRIYGCFVGFMSELGNDFGNAGSGISIFKSDYDDIGGPEDWQRNFITTNYKYGILVYGAKKTLIMGNSIGWIENTDHRNNDLDGIKVHVSDSLFIRSNTILGNSYHGIALNGTSGCMIDRNFIGSSFMDGIFINNESSRNRLFMNTIGLSERTTSDSNDGWGILVETASDSNYIGGAADSGNVISDNGKGGISIQDCKGNIIAGNRIGTDKTGQVSFGNHGHGILLDGSVGTMVGERWDNQAMARRGAGNTISGNDSVGVMIMSTTYESRDNLIASNVIGMTADSQKVMGNSWGVVISGSNNNHVGAIDSTGAPMGNLISENWYSGVFLQGSNDCFIRYNKIRGNGKNGGNGLTLDFSVENIIEGNNISRNYGHGVFLDNTSGLNKLFWNVIGLNDEDNPDGNDGYGIMVDNQSQGNFIGITADSGNVISSNGKGGVKLVFSDDNTVAGNFIGTDPTGLLDRGNHGHGVHVDACLDSRVGRGWSLQHQEVLGEGNIISGNDSAGVKVTAEASLSNGIKIGSNLIGVGVDSATAIPNLWGVFVESATRTFIGSAARATGNLIKANRMNGIVLASDSSWVQSNRIELNGYGKTEPSGLMGGDGVYVYGASNTIDQPHELQAQIIKENNGAGIRIAGENVNANRMNIIQYNEISGNISGGIDLDPPGPNPNDSLDADLGPNEGQNTPRIYSATVVSNSWLLVRGFLISKPNEWYQLDVYGNDECDPAGLGQGAKYLFSDTLNTDADGIAIVNLDDSLVTSLPTVITLTATDLAGNTSEFSNCYTVITDGFDLAISKTDLIDTVAPFDTMHYQIAVTNFGPDTAKGVTVVDTLPSQITYLTDSISQGSSVLTNNILNCDLGDLVAGGEVLIDLYVRADQIGTIVNYAYVASASPDAFLANNTAADTTIATDVQTDIADEESNIPTDYSLSQNYPNPFNPETVIEFSLPMGGSVQLEIFNIVGQRIVLLIDSKKAAGYHTINWDGRDSSGQLVSSGVYLYRLRAGSFEQTNKMLLLK